MNIFWTDIRVVLLTHESILRGMREKIRLTFFIFQTFYFTPCGGIFTHVEVMLAGLYKILCVPDFSVRAFHSHIILRLLVYLPELQIKFVGFTRERKK